MKTKRFFVKAICTLAACGLMTSCINKDSNNDLIISQSFLYFFNAIFTEDDDQPKYQNNLSYGYDCNYTNLTTDITIQGLTLPGTSYSTIKLPQLPWKADNGWKLLSSSSVNASSESVAPTFNNFTFNLYDRNVKVYSQGTLTEIYYPLVKVAYQLDNYKYTVISLPRGVINEGTTYITNQKGETYQQTDSRYFIQLVSSTSLDLNDDTNRMATMTIYDAKFDEKMPAMNMVFENIPFNVDNRGRITLECEALTPSLLNASDTTTPMPNFPISELSGFTDASNNMHLTFICTMAQSGTVYNVTVECQQPS